MVRDFLKTEQQATEDSLRDAEHALASFMAAHPRFALDATPLATGAAIRATIRPALASTAGPAFGERSSPSFGVVRPPAGAPASATNAASGDVRTSPGSSTDILRAKAALAAAQANLSDLAARFTPAHPDVRAAQAEVERATSRLEAAMSEAAASRPEVGQGPAHVAYAPPPAVVARVAMPTPTTDPRPAGRSVASAATVPGRPGASHDDVVALETEWVKLTRGATEARQHEDQVEAALFEAKNTQEEGDHGVRVIVIDPAFLPQTAVPPGRTTIVALFAGASLLVATIAALLKALLGDRVYVARDIEYLAPLLAEVPRGAHA
jgi:uncharacterized protein involved in exopolysaccharide biosynthesis